MKKRIVISNILLAVLLVGCNNTQEGTTTIEELKGVTLVQTETTNTVSVVSDSIAALEFQINTLRDSQMSKKEEIAFLISQRDSITNTLSQIDQSLEQVNSKKIAPGINSINAKLDELKRQRENLTEQQELQKSEKTLAEKRIALLSEEKAVYDAQRASLYDKGAAPENFVVVDSLLSGINSKISEQSKKIKNLERNIDDVEEQKVVIIQQRSSLSSKIRNNYSAKQIFDDFAKEEKSRLEGKLQTIEGALEQVLNDDKDMDGRLALHTSKKNAFETEKNINAEHAASAEREAAINAEHASLESQLAKEKANKDGKKLFGLLGIVAVAVLLLMFYLLGKAKKRRKLKN